MEKIEPAELMDDISHDLVVYLREGRMETGSFLQKVDPGISGLRRLLEIHFVLQDEVVQFVEQLPLRLRRLKTATRKETAVSQGLVQGRVVWGDTVRERLRRNPADRTVHVSEHRTQEIQIKENTVLLRLLHIIREVLVRDIKHMTKKGYSWLGKWAESAQIERFLEVVDRNIYLQQLEAVAVTERMINDTLQSRSGLYREAAELLILYRNLVSPDRWRHMEDYQEQITQLLSSTFISPENEDTLFELYWTIRLIRNLSLRATLHLIEPGSDEVASAEDEQYQYRIYHNSTGPKDVDFRVDLDELADAGDQYTRRLYWSRSQVRRLSPELLGHTVNQLWSGRPDILLEVRSKATGYLAKLLIGEVKNTTRKSYAAEGLEQLLDYMAFVKYKGEYLSFVGADSEVEGMLFVNNMSLDSQHSQKLSVYTLQQQKDLSRQIALRFK